MPKFEPIDIIPLVNMAFPKSFENRENAIIAITDRGWNPLNFNILTTLPAATKNCISHPEVNIENGAVSNYLDQLIGEEKKSEGRKKSIK
jgi:hypothetical protein